MLRFRIGSIPVDVRPTHLLLAGFLAWSMMPSARDPDPSRMMLAILAGMFVVFFSVLVHELGHALVAKAYGFQPAIVLEMFGGHTAPNATKPISWLKEILLSFAGPFFGLTLGIAAFAVLGALGTGDFVDTLKAAASPEAPLWAQTLGLFGLANMFWAVMNLLPVLPLDGGHISHAIATRIFGKRGVLASQGLSLVLSAAVAAWGVSSGSIFLAIFFGMYAVQALQMLAAYFKSDGEGADQAAPHPADLAFAQSAALFGERKYREAREVAERALNSFPSPPQPSRIRLHHLLGWISVKEGYGKEALDHFSQLGAEQAEPQALAAAFALTGDDHKALPLWELAFRTSKDPGVLSEWAGTLIRLGRVGDARRLSGVNLEEAWRAAASVLYLREDYDGAAMVGAQAVEQFPSAELAYNAACAFAKAGKVLDAQSMLDRAAKLGFKDGKHAAADPDLAALRHTSAFNEWLKRVQQSATS